MGKLTEKQRRFVDAYIETGNAAEAARRAGQPPRLQVLRLTKGTAGPRPRKLSE